jgi:hypothetical protein
MHFRSGMYFTYMGSVFPTLHSELIDPADPSHFINSWSPKNKQKKKKMEAETESKLLIPKPVETK